MSGHADRPGWQEQFDLRLTDLDFRGELDVLSLWKLFQEAGGKHVASLGFDAATLRPQGFTWVLAKFHLKLHGTAKWRDRVTIHTWRTGFLRNFTFRDYRALATDGSLLAEATSCWALFDMNARASAALPESIQRNYPLEADRLRLPPVRKVNWSRVEGRDGARRFDTRLSEIDENRHVTNGAYVHWLIDALDPVLVRQSRCREVSLTFHAESFLGETVLSEYRLDHSDAGKTGIMHRITREGDGAQLVTATTFWER